MNKVCAKVLGKVTKQRIGGNGYFIHLLMMVTQIADERVTRQMSPHRKVFSSNNESMLTLHAVQYKGR